MGPAGHQDSGRSAAELVFRTSLALLGQLTAAKELPIADILESIRMADPIPTRHNNSTPPSEPPQQLRQATMVYIRRGGQLPPLTPPYDGPYLVLERGPKFFKLQVGDREVNITVDHLKPHKGAAPATLAAPDNNISTSNITSTEKQVTFTGPASSHAGAASAHAQAAQQVRPLISDQRSEGSQVEPSFCHM